ncbi:DUF3017 domain-containing protein [Corynebacterium crudilactis]|uniref:DUF3017 domain-containing protein n=1 Tax=Corynebacterium crudilactis TaxID=1652495 RepID=A0A172QRM8_9CORY|nr:DUF3017 domain-containing protein [Corynebacterium crudilactis]ANE03328.1 hypothetical protein ccrud_03265 [Corynebacterium crudilactis]
MTNPGHGKQGISEEQLLANPHDGGLAASTLPHNVQKAGVIFFVIAVVVATIFALTEHWRRATFTLGVSLLYLAVLRLTCDSKILGVLSVRSRRFDAIYTTVLGGLMVFLAASVDSLGS